MSRLDEGFKMKGQAKLYNESRHFVFWDFVTQSLRDDEKIPRTISLENLLIVVHFVVSIT